MFFFFFSVLATVAHGRPTVRELRNYREYQKLLDHHAEETGLPVVVDFYSNSCGPCRMIAPVYKRVAEEYKDKVVFAKVNMEANRETSNRLGIRSMPTFHFYSNGKKQHEFSGAGEHQLRQLVQRMAFDFEKKNVLLSLDALIDYYATVDPLKSLKDIEKIHKKCISLNGKAKACVGSAAKELGSKLETKFGRSFKLEKRYQRGHAKVETTFAEKRSSSSQKGKETIRDLSIDELITELGRRANEDGDELALSAFEAADAYLKAAEEDKEDFEDLDDDDIDETLPEYTPPQHKHNAEPELVVVLGGGPAGLSAAIYAGRAGLSPIVVAPPGEGQLLSKGVTVENFPGTNSTGIDLVQRMQLHAAEVGAAFYPYKVMRAHLRARPFILETSSGLNISTHTLIIATGANARWLGVQGESDFRGGGVSSCATCDGFLFRDKDVVVIGGGDAAMEDALVLARTSSSVTIIHRRDKFRASHAMADRALQHPLISVKWNTTVSKFSGRFEDFIYYDNHGNQVQGERPFLEHVHLKNAFTGEPTQVLNASAAFVAIGHDPNTKWLPDELVRDSQGYLIHANALNCNESKADFSRFVTALSVPGVFAAGDVADPTYRQAITSAGSGAAAALDAERFLSEVVGVGITPGCAAATLTTEIEDLEGRDILDDILMADDKLHHEDEHFFEEDDLPTAAHHQYHHSSASSTTTKNSEL